MEKLEWQLVVDQVREDTNSLIYFFQEEFDRLSQSRDDKNVRRAYDEYKPRIELDKRAISLYYKEQLQQPKPQNSYLSRLWSGVKYAFESILWAVSGVIQGVSLLVRKILALVKVCFFTCSLDTM